MYLWTSEDGVVIADRDADGAIAAAIILYLQERGLFPSKKKLAIHLFPSRPGIIDKLFSQFSGCPEFYAFLDIPFTAKVASVLRKARMECPGSKLIYVDHHFSSLENLGFIRRHCDFCLVNEGEPTSMHLVRLANREGYRLSERLRLYAQAIGYIELARRPPPELMKVVELVASIARALKLEERDDFWKKIVHWLASSLPIPMGKADSEVLMRVEREASIRDKELDEAVTDLSVSAQRIGCFRFVDARKRWKRRGVSSLATRLSRKMRSPVALLAVLGDEEILVIRTRNRAARTVAEELVEHGIALDTAGHSNLAIVKLRRNYDAGKMREILIKSCRYVA